MNDCDHAQDAHAYYDNELPGEQRRAFEAHLRTCETCAGEIARLKALSRLLVEARAPTLPPDAVQRLHDKAPLVKERVILTLAARLAAAAMVVIAVCAGLLATGIGGRGASAAAIQTWELTAVRPESAAAATSEGQMAKWILTDLSLENGHE